jgi:RNase P protein component
MQTLVGSVAPGWDLVLTARPALASSDFFAVHEALLTLLRRADLVRPS